MNVILSTFKIINILEQYLAWSIREENGILKVGFVEKKDRE